LGDKKAETRIKIDNNSKMKLDWLREQMLDCERNRSCYAFNYEGTLTAFLLKNSLDPKKMWHFDEAKGEIFEVEKPVAKENENGSSTNVDNASK